MDVVGSEIGQKMRSAIKAKLTELGCYVDDELPDYVMVMVANKRTRSQMEEDLQLFLGDNTELFVNWLHQVLKKLQEVTVPPLKPEAEKPKEKVKEKKSKDKKEKDKTKSKKGESVKKSKKKDKEKDKLRKKEEKKAHKSKKKSKRHEIIRPNVPPLLMNMEKESEPSITDVFAGQILKNHGITVDAPKEEIVEKKPIVTDIKRPILPIIDPATINQPEVIDITSTSTSQENRASVSSAGAPRDEQIKEINEIEAKIQGLKQKLAEQLDSMSDDEDFLNIRTEAEELMNDFAEDVFQEISAQAPPVATPPITSNISTPLSPPQPPKVSKPIHSPKESDIEPPQISKESPKTQEPEVLPQIELNLPKRPVRERLGAREERKKVEEESSVKEKEDSAKNKMRTDSPERFTPEKEPDFWGKYKSSARSRLGDPPEPTRRSPITHKRSSFSEDSDSDTGYKRERRVSRSSSERGTHGPQSVVRVRPRPRARPAPASNLLLRAVADAHKSLFNIPPKKDVDSQPVKRALVHPMRRCVDAQNIVIHVPADRHDHHPEEKRPKTDLEKEEYIPASITKKITNTDYVPSRRLERTSSRRDDTLIIETINIHNTTVDKDKDTQFIVTMDGFNPNAFLAKKLKTEGLLDDEEILDKPKEHKPVLRATKPAPKTTVTDKTKEITDEVKDKKIEESKELKEKKIEEKKEDKAENIVEAKEVSPQKKRLSDTSHTSDDSDTQVIIKQDVAIEDKAEKRKIVETPQDNVDTSTTEISTAKKRKASPIVFDVKKEKAIAGTRERTESASSDNHVVITTAINTHKYDSVPSLSAAEKKLVWCRSFPLCRYGAACAFQHPRCKFAAACTRRNCPYSHSGVAIPAPVVPTPPTVASHVVPVANFKTISGVVANICKYYPNCVNPACHFYHPKPCRYGKACANKLECNFYHNDQPSKWRYPV